MIKPLLIEKFWEIASELSGLSELSIKQLSDESVIDSALHAPFAGFGDTDVYPNFYEKVGVLGYRLIKAHGLPDRNKRTATAAMEEFSFLNGYTLEFSDPHKALLILTQAAGNRIDESEFVEFVRDCLNPIE